MNKNIRTLSLLLSILILISACASYNPHAVYFPHAQADLNNENSSFWQANPITIWNQLQQTSTAKLQIALTKIHQPEINAWLNLALISKQNSNHSSILIDKLIEWRQTWPTHPANELFPNDEVLLSISQSRPPQHIALLLPLTGQYAEQGKRVRDGFLATYYTSSARTQSLQTISFFDTNQDFSVRSAYQQALAEGADFIVGPLLEPEVEQIIGAANSSVPTLALNYTNHHLPSHFYEFGLSSQDEAQQVANKARNAGGLRAILIAPQSTNGQKTAHALITQWKSIGGKMTDTYYFSNHAPFAQDIAHLMKVDLQADQAQILHVSHNKILPQQRRHDFDVIFLIASSQEARAVVPLLKYYYASDVPIYATSAIYSSTLSPQKEIDLNGVHFLDIPWLLRKPSLPSPSSPQFSRLYAVGMDAYLLSQEMPRLTMLSYFPLYGATGALTLNADQHIYRHLPWVQIHAGRL